jgi:hypothetical protein
MEIHQRSQAEVADILPQKIEQESWLKQQVRDLESQVSRMREENKKVCTLRLVL